MVRRVALAGAMAALLIASMFFVYKGAFSSTDEEYLFDAVESFVRRGDFRLNLTYSVRPFSIMAFDSEVMQVMVAAPLFWLADRLPRIGLAHAVFLLNILVTVATAIVLFAHTLAQGHGEKVAIGIGLLFSLTTIALPYSQTFFREPLSAFFLISGVCALSRWGDAFDDGRGGWGWLPMGWGLYICAVLTKGGMLLALPVVLVAMVPTSVLRGFDVRGRWPRMAAAGAVSMVILMAGWWVLSHYGSLFRSGYGRFDPVGRLTGLRVGFGEFVNALAGYLLSPGKSMFVYSPVLILGVAGAVIAVRKGKMSDGSVPLVALTVFPAAYALLRNEVWYGGKCWGPRYMVPITPVLMLGVPYALDRIADDGHRWVRLAVIALAVLSFLAQVPGFSVRQGLIDEEIGRAGSVWTIGVWNPVHSPIVTGYRLLGRAAGREWAWNLTGQVSVPVLCAIVAVIWGAVIVLLLKSEPSPRSAAAMVIGAMVSAVLLLGIGLGLYYDGDVRYRADDRRLRDLLVYIEENVRPDDLLVLNNPNYKYFFFNYYKLDAPMLLPLPYSPGEAYSPQQPAERISSNPDDLIMRAIPPTLLRLRSEHPVIWLVVDSGPYIDYAVRPVERWLTRHFFPLGEYAADPMARLVRFAGLDAPAPEEPRWPYNMTRCRFGDVLTLVGYDLAGGPTYRPGKPIGISLLWRSERTPGVDYTVAVFLADPVAGPIAQHDSFPSGGFEPTAGWGPREYHRDNHGLQVPEDAIPGEYELWAVVYTWWDGAKLPVECADGWTGEYARLGVISVGE